MASQFESINDSSIGRQKEKSLHLQLKNHLCADSNKQEVKIDQFFVDIYDKGIITEIQTGNFYAMRKKLSVLLPNYYVKIVYPLASEKVIHWVDPETGEIQSRKSPRKNHPLKVCKELYFLKNMLNDPNLEIQVIMCKIDEYRYLDGYNQTKKRGATKIDQIPTWFDEVIVFKDKTDYQKHLTKLPEQFTVKDFAKVIPLSPKEVSLAIQVLKTIGAIEMVGKLGKAYIYSLSK